MKTEQKPEHECEFYLDAESKVYGCECGCITINGQDPEYCPIQWRDDLLSRVEELEKENERLKEDSNKDLFVIGSQLQQIGTLTEQVEKWESKSIELVNLIESQSHYKELSALRDRERELVELINNIRTTIWFDDSDSIYIAKIWELLNKAGFKYEHP